MLGSTERRRRIKLALLDQNLLEHRARCGAATDGSGLRLRWNRRKVDLERGSGERDRRERRKEGLCSINDQQKMEHGGRQRKEVPSRELAFEVKRKEALAVQSSE